MPYLHDDFYVEVYPLDVNFDQEMVAVSVFLGRGGWVKENTRRPVKSYDDVEEVVGGEERRCHSLPTSVDP